MEPGITWYDVLGVVPDSPGRIAAASAAGPVPATKPNGRTNDTP
jgi:hypothetical protein